MTAILRTFLAIVLFVAIAFLALGYWGGSRFSARSTAPPAPSDSVGTSGSIDKARETGAEIGEKAAVAAKKVGDSMEEAALTTKIKAKMALDDSVKARTIDVATSNRVVTLKGSVRSVAEHDRAVQLAKETAGVTQVVDRLTVVPQ